MVCEAKTKLNRFEEPKYYVVVNFKSVHHDPTWTEANPCPKAPGPSPREAARLDVNLNLKFQFQSLMIQNKNKIEKKL